jgi:hypothetical protein
MHKYHILFQLLHLNVSVYMTILRVLVEYISVVMCKVQYICIYKGMTKTEHRVVVKKKLKFVKILMCAVCCVHTATHRANFNFLAIKFVKMPYVLLCAHDNTQGKF